VGAFLLFYSPVAETEGFPSTEKICGIYVAKAKKKGPQSLKAQFSSPQKRELGKRKGRKGPKVRRVRPDDRIPTSLKGEPGKNLKGKEFTRKKQKTGYQCHGRLVEKRKV